MSNKPTYAQPPYETDIDQIAIGESITIFTPGGGAPIATVLNYDDFPCADEEILEAVDREAVATARLFVAAPDMLKALRSIPYRYLEDMDRHTPGAANLIRDAIEKATTGGQR